MPSDAEHRAASAGRWSGRIDRLPLRCSACRLLLWSNTFGSAALQPSLQLDKPGHNQEFFWGFTAFQMFLRVL